MARTHQCWAELPKWIPLGPDVQECPEGVPSERRPSERIHPGGQQTIIEVIKQVTQYLNLNLKLLKYRYEHRRKKQNCPDSYRDERWRMADKRFVIVRNIYPGKFF